jgi:hypothetical protein
MAAADTDLTVVIMTLVGGGAPQRLRAVLQSQGARVVIPDAAATSGRERSVPMLRQRALEAARTAYVAFLEDTATPEPGWCQAIREALADPAVGAVAGPVAISAGLAPQARALGFTEYAPFQASRFRELASGPGPDDVRTLPGIAFAARRADLLPIVQAMPNGLFEGEALLKLAQAGKAVRYAPDMKVTYALPYAEGAALGTRFQHGRLYGGSRVAGVGVPRRLAYALAAGLLPAILTLRTLKDAPDALKGSPATLAWVLAMHSAWSLGEFTGYVTGGVGDSLKRWR